MSFELGVLVKTSLILLGAAALVFAARKAAAAARHTIWAVALLSTLILPLGSLVLPELSVRYRPESNKTIAWMTDAVAVVETVSPGRPTLLPDPLRHQPRTRQWLVLAWGIGIAIVVLRFVFGIQAVWNLKRNSRPTADPHWLELLANLKRILGVTSRVELRIGGEGIPPMTWGIFRHTILLPSSAAGWASERLSHAIAHELAHVKRGDGVLQMAIQPACAVYWFHPLVWVAAYRMRVERERACDDEVLNTGVNPEDYADHLLQIAREATIHWGGAGVAMTHRSGFATRLHAILDSKNNRRSLSRRSIAAFAGATVLVTVFLATLNLRAVPTPQAPAPRWAGTWKLNKLKSDIGHDSRIQSMLDSVASMTLKLEPASDGVIIKSDLIGVQPNVRQQSEFALKFGVPTNGKEVSPLLAVSYPATVTMIPTLNNVLSLTITYLDGSGSQTLRFAVSSDGNTLAEFLPPPNDMQVVFDRQF